MNAIERLLGDTNAERAKEGDPIAQGIDSIEETRTATGTAQGHDVAVRMTYECGDGSGAYHVKVEFAPRSVSSQGLCKYTAEALFEKLARDYDLEEGDFDDS